MIPYTNGNRQKKIIAFSLALLATAGIVIILMATFRQYKTPLSEEKDSSTLSSVSRYTKLLTENQVLASRLTALQNLDKQYADQLTTPGNKTQLDSINNLISQQEEVFRESIDSIFYNLPEHTDTSLDAFQNNVVSFYKAMLANRHTQSSLRNAISFDKKDLTTDELSALKTRNQLQEKDDRIALMESSVKAMTAARKNVIATPVAGTDNSKKLAEDISTLQNNVADLSSANMLLKQDNEKLLKQQRDVMASANSGELAYKNRVGVLQQKVDVLDAELRLARVDCNLSRVDAAQIISNARQRKQLLSEASGILKNLADADDAGIKKKVQDKIVQLNHVAANSRD